MWPPKRWEIESGHIRISSWVQGERRRRRRRRKQLRQKKGPQLHRLVRLALKQGRKYLAPKELAIINKKEEKENKISERIHAQ
jgi:hypothetical protein